MKTLTYKVEIKNIETNEITETRHVTIEAPMNSYDETGKLIAAALGLVKKPHTFGTLKTGKLDMYFQCDKKVRFMCYNVPAVVNTVTTGDALKLAIDMLEHIKTGGNYSIFEFHDKLNVIKNMFAEYCA